MRFRKTLGVGVIGAVAAASFAGGALLGGGAGAAPAQSSYVVEVTITNVAPDGGGFLTPVWAALHDGSFDLYDGGDPASAELERLAEDGNTAPISGLFATDGNGTDTTIPGPAGPLFPGDSATHHFLVTDPTDAANRYLSLASMVIPSNDAFIANGDPVAHPVFDASGQDVSSSFTILGSNVLDAGTEVNDEIPEHTAALAQAAPDTGVTENGVVGPHAGFMPAGNILAAVPNGDFTQPGYEVAQVDVEVREVNLANRIIYSVLDPFQEVPAIEDSRALGYGLFRVRSHGKRLLVNTQFWNIDNVVAAHLHYGARGENGPVVVDLLALSRGGNPNTGAATDVTIDKRALTGPFTGMTMDALLDAIAQGKIYINVHTTDVPSGEMRGQLVD